MSVDEYLKQNIDFESIKKAQEFIESSQYKEMQKIVESENYKMAQEALKMRDSWIHKDTLVQIEKLQKDIESISSYMISQSQLNDLRAEQENIQKMLRVSGIKYD